MWRWSRWSRSGNILECHALDGPDQVKESFMVRRIESRVVRNVGDLEFEANKLKC